MGVRLYLVDTGKPFALKLFFKGFKPGGAGRGEGGGMVRFAFRRISLVASAEKEIG